MYLDLLKRTLTRYQLEEYSDLEQIGLREVGRKARIVCRINAVLRPVGVGLGQVRKKSLLDREGGLDWPLNAETMVGLKRLDHLQGVLDVVRSDDIPGGVMETGVWRGGSMIFAAGFMKAHQMDRKIYVADSFEGLPQPDEAYPLDAGDLHHKFSYLGVDLETVKANFKKYGLLNENVIFVEGFFEDSLPNVEVDQLSVLRLDGDMYSSTMQVLQTMYSRVSQGGFVIIDDYSLHGCREAVHDYLNANGLSPVLETVDSASIYWRV
jgi:O-methyltransferase